VSSSEEKKEKILEKDEDFRILQILLAKLESKATNNTRISANCQEKEKVFGEIHSGSVCLSYRLIVFAIQLFVLFH
jgi:hypothetical protein